MPISVRQLMAIGLRWRVLYRFMAAGQVWAILKGTKGPNDAHDVYTLNVNRRGHAKLGQLLIFGGRSAQG